METQFDYPDLREMVKLCRELQEENRRLDAECRFLRGELSRSEAEIAWAAALFEGEGCLHCSKTGLVLGLAMCDEDVVQRWGRIIGAGRMRCEPPRGSGTKPQYHWAVYKIADVEAICFRLRPWLGTRRCQQFDTAFEKYWSTRR